MILRDIKDVTFLGRIWVVGRFSRRETLLNVHRATSVRTIVHQLTCPECAEIGPTVEAAIGGLKVGVEQGLVFVQEDADEDGMGGV